MQRDLVEYVTRHYSIGWLSSSDDGVKHVYAMLDGRVIGAASANIVRDDLLAVSASAHAFIIVFKEPLKAEQIDAVEVYAAGLPEAVQRAHKVKLQRDEARQVLCWVRRAPAPRKWGRRGRRVSACLGWATYVVTPPRRRGRPRRGATSLGIFWIRVSNPVLLQNHRPT